MKPWIKIEYSLLSDDRMKRLITDSGIKGLGLYTLLRLLVSCRCEGKMPMKEMLEAASCYARRQHIRRVITDYGLFEVSDDDLVSAPSQAPARECVPEQVPGQVPEQVPGQACAGVPLLTISDEMDKRKNKKERENMGGENAPAHTREAEAGESLRLEEVREGLCGHLSAIWRESLGMQLNDYDLMLRHWPWCVDYFLTHVGALDEGLGSLQEARRRFVCFVRHPLTGQRFYQQLHRHDKEVQSREAAVANGQEAEEAQLREYMQAFCPHLCEMEDPLTLDEFRRLRDEFGKERVRQVLTAMENRPGLERRSVYVTARDWLGRERK